MKNKKYILRPNHGSHAVFKSLNKNTAKKLIKFLKEGIYEPKRHTVINGVKYTLLNWHYSRDGYDGISFYFITDTNKYIRISNHWCGSIEYARKNVQMVLHVGQSNWYLKGTDNSFSVQWRSRKYALEGGSIPLNKFDFYRYEDGRIEK